MRKKWLKTCSLLFALMVAAGTFTACKGDDVEDNPRDDVEQNGGNTGGSSGGGANDVAPENLDFWLGDYSSDNRILTISLSGMEETLVYALGVSTSEGNSVTSGMATPQDGDYYTLECEDFIFKFNASNKTVEVIHQSDDDDMAKYAAVYTLDGDNNAGTSGSTVETDYNAEDFYGCWKYDDEDDWLYIYGDGTYEWFDEDGSYGGGSYYMDGNVLYFVNSTMHFSQSGTGDSILDTIGEPLRRSELPNYSGTPSPGYSGTPYFAQGDYDFSLEMDSGRMNFDDGIYYYYTDGSYYINTYCDWALSTVKDELRDDGYRDIGFTATCYFPYSSDPELPNRHTLGFFWGLFDYYSGEWIPTPQDMTEAHSQVLNVNGEDVLVQYMVEDTWQEDMGDSSYICTVHMAVRIPADYDGLVFAALPAPDDMDECIAINNESNTYATGVLLEDRVFIDEDDGLYCRIR